MVGTTVIALGIIVAIGFFMIGIMVNKGLGVTGLSRTCLLGIVHHLRSCSWVGISHAGIMISAILRLSQAECDVR